MQSDKISFIRFGNLGSYFQHGYHANPDLIKDDPYYFYSPPAKSGFYAFPRGYYFDFYFLIGATLNPDNPSGKSAWLKDKDGSLHTASRR